MTMTKVAIQADAECIGHLNKMDGETHGPDGRERYP